MISIKWIKKHTGNMVMIIGIIIIALSVLSTIKWKYSQYKLFSEHQEKLLEEKELHIESLLQQEANYEYESQDDIQYKNEEKKQVLNRENYKSGMMIIGIPKIQVKAAVMEGTTSEYLKEGPGLYEISPLPSEYKGNVCIAGHRTTYGAWFRHVDTLKEGNFIILELDGLKYFYKVERVFIVKKNDWSVTKSLGYSALTLTACHPLRSSKQRIVVRAKLVKFSSTPIVRLVGYCI